MKITSFRGEHSFLSNFHPLPTGKTVEHFYQAAKASNMYDYVGVLECDTPGQAKRAGQRIEVRSDWNDIKLIVMEQLLINKFSNLELCNKLLQTGDVIIEEQNTWGDQFWGICDNIGHNPLGKLLMKIRDEYLFVTP